MEYNTAKDKLVIREYGRNIQNFIKYATTVENREERNQIAAYIIDMMSQLNPQMRNVEEYQRKLWDHLYAISDFKLDIDYPYPKPDPDAIIPKSTEKMPYPKEKIRFKHYGKNVETMIDRAKQMEDQQKQHDFAETIANYMKLAYNNWHNENVNDELIKGDLETLSGGELTLSDDSNLDALRQSNRRKKAPTRGRHSSKGRSSNRSSSGSRTNTKRGRRRN